MSDVNHVIITKSIVTAAIPLRNARFGLGSGLILLDYLQCTGSESNLLECRRSSATITCNVYGVAGVQCTGNNSMEID